MLKSSYQLLLLDLSNYSDLSWKKLPGEDPSVLGAPREEEAANFAVWLERNVFFLGMWVLPKMVGFPSNHGFFLLKMIILGCFGGTTI